MKKFALLFAAVFAFATLSCTNDNPDDPGKDEGKKELTSLVSKASTWNVDKRLFDLSFSGEGVAVATQLIGFDANLGAGKYKLVAEASAAAGDAVLEKTLLNEKAVSAGTVQVLKNGNKYTFNFTLTADGKDVELTWSGDIEWPQDPAPKQVLTQLLSASANQAGEEGFTLTVNLGTAGISAEQDPTTYQTVWKGEGGYLALDIFSTDRYLHEGVYKANTVGGVLAEGEFGIGYDTQVEFWGQMYDVTWGSLWYAVKDGAATIDHKIVDGIVVVRQIEGGWQISWGKDYPTEYVFEGPIDALTEPENAGEAPVVEITSGLTYTIEDQTATNYADADNTPLSGVQLFRIQVWSGTDFVAEFDLVVTEGTTDFTGTYTVKSYPHENLTAGNGWGFAAYNFFGGSFYVFDGAVYFLPIDAILKVTDTAGTLKFEFEGKVQNADYVDVEGGSLLLDNVAKAA